LRRYLKGELKILFFEEIFKRIIENTFSCVKYRNQTWLKWRGTQVIILI